jgi:hypothetical protein
VFRAQEIVAVFLLLVAGCTINIRSDAELDRIFGDAGASGSLRSSVNPIGYAADIDLERIDNTVTITADDQLDEFLAASLVPWTRILVADGVTLSPTQAIIPAVGVKIYCPAGSFTIDGRSTDEAVILFQNEQVYMANFVLRVPAGDLAASNNPYIGIKIDDGSADLIYLQSFGIDAPGDLGQNDASESISIWIPEGPAGRITFDRAMIITTPSSGTKGARINGPDASTMRVTLVHSVIRSHEFGVNVSAGAFVDYVNNVSPTEERIAVIEVYGGGRARARASFFHPRIAVDPGDEIVLGGDSSGLLSLGPEPNTAHPGVTLTSLGDEVPVPPYPTPPIWDEATIMDNAGAGTILLPSD